MDDLVSIITPAYNAENLLEQTIRSVLSQTYSNWEMIIVDDCSADGTVAIAERYCTIDPRFVLLKNERNQGVAQTRNNGIKAARGKYIAFLDSDDLWLPEKLEVQISFMKKNAVAVAFSDYSMFDSTSGECKKTVHVPKILTAKQLLGNTIMGCLTVVIDREQTGNFEMPPLSHGEDMITWYNILRKGFVAYGIQTVLAKYRICDSSLSGNKSKSVKQQWYLYREYLGFSLIKSLYYFFCYAVHAALKSFF